MDGSIGASKRDSRRLTGLQYLQHASERARRWLLHSRLLLSRRLLSPAFASAAFASAASDLEGGSLPTSTVTLRRCRPHRRPLSPTTPPTKGGHFRPLRRPRKAATVARYGAVVASLGPVVAGRTRIKALVYQGDSTACRVPLSFIANAHQDPTFGARRRAWCGRRERRGRRGRRARRAAGGVKEGALRLTLQAPYD